MTATYFSKGRGHSLRGQYARDKGARCWSKLPASLRRGLTSAQASMLYISSEWHHAGKFATEVYVYYPAQVQAFMDVIDNSDYTLDDLVDAVQNRSHLLIDDPETYHREVAPLFSLWSDARMRADDVREELLRDDDDELEV